MKSWVVLCRAGEWGLYIRDYPAQGVNPDYALFKKISVDTALDLVESRLADDLYNSLAL